MKKILTMFIILGFMIYVAWPINAASSTNVSIESISVNTGQTIEVPIKMTGNTGICGAVFTIAYDEALTLTNIEKGDAFDELSMTNPGNYENNPVNIVWDGEENDSSNGTIATLIFEPMSETGTYDITVSYDPDNIIDSNYDPVELTAQSGTVKVIADSQLEKLQITEQPVNYTGAEGSTVQFHVGATGSNLTYQWQYSDDVGKNWYNSVAKTADFNIQLTSKRNNRWMRCIITDGAGNQVISNVVTMKIKTSTQPIQITKQPTNYTGTEGSKVSFHVEAVGETLTYQWQYSDDYGKNWYNSSSRTADFSIELTSRRNNRWMRCIITDASGNSVTTQTVVMKIETASSQVLSIVKQPVDYTGPEGSTVEYIVEANGENLSYQWQYSDDKGKHWYYSSTRAAKFTIELTAKRNNRIMRCIVKDSNGNEIISNIVTMTIADTSTAKLHIIKQPVNYVGAEGSKVAFFVQATGDNLTYQWQYSDNRGKDWHNSSARTPEFSIELTSKRNNRYMRCIIKDESGNEVISDIVTMKIGTAQAISIVKQPVNYTGALGSNVTYSVEATGTDLTYQWQYSDNRGKDWHNSSAKTPEFSIELTSKRNNRYMRCIITDAFGNQVITDVVTMKIAG